MEIRADIIIANRFKIVKKIGSGSFGKCYQGLDMLSNEKIAIKIVSSNYFYNYDQELMGNKFP